MRRQAAVIALLVLAAACGGDTSPPPTLVDREAFIETYVELRLAAIRSGSFAATAEERDEIFQRQGIGREALISFVDAHGRDTEYMAELWADVDARLTERRNALSEEESGPEPR